MIYSLMKASGVLLQAYLLAFLISPGTAFAIPMLTSGATDLSFPRQSYGGYGIELDTTGTVGASFPFVQPSPLSVEVVNDHGYATWLNGDYSSVKITKVGIVATGRVESENGTGFLFADTYEKRVNDKAIVLCRIVTVQSPSVKDKGFSTRFSMPAHAKCDMSDFDFLVPGIWYKQNKHVPPYALASNPENKDFYFREDRTPLPFVMMRDRGSGITVILLHIHGDPVTYLGDKGRTRVISSAMKFGSVGITNHSNPGVAFWYPGSEGKGTYAPGRNNNTQWAYRDHPVINGFQQRYQLLLRINRTPDYPDAVKRSWLTAWREYHPSAPHADTRLAYLDCMKLLATVCHPYDGVDGIPFELTVPRGVVPHQGALSGEMGFVGQQIPACAMALRYGLETNNPKLIESASKIIDYWVENATTPSGVLRTWYDITPDGKRKWRDYPMYLRVASDGLIGVLEAWRIMKVHGYDHPAWLRFAQNYGDWLLKNQNPDGSFYRTYDFNGQPINLTTDTTNQPISFLVDLSLATGDKKYIGVARKAGKFCLKSVDKRYAYVGGTPDNPNVMDKEAGVVAMGSFLALYDVTHDSRYLKAAVQAAWFTETWTYGWNIPMLPKDPMCDFPKGRSSVGISLIATGHSGADNFMVREPFIYYRLYLLTGITQFRDFARVILYNSERMMDLDRTMGYAMPGLQIEAMTLSIPRGHSVRMWLPWLTVGALEPLIHFQETFGTMNLSALEKMPLKTQKIMSMRFGLTQGFTITKILKTSH